MVGHKGKRTTIRVIALVASLALVIGLLPTAAFAKAAENVSGTNSGAPAMQAASADDLAAASSERGTIGAQDDKQDCMEFVKTLIEAGAVSAIDPEEGASKMVEWTAETLCDKVFGVAFGKQEATNLNQIYGEIEELKQEIATLQRSVDCDDLNNILNEVVDLFDDQTTDDAMSALLKADASKDSTDVKRQKRLRALTDDLGIDKDHWEATNNTYDLFAWKLWTVMSTPYKVTLSGQTHNFTLLRTHYEYLRYNNHWEHKAYAEWKAYQTQCVGLLITALSLEKASLQARIQRINDWNADKAHKGDQLDTGACERHLAKIQDILNQVTGGPNGQPYKGKDADGNNVTYAGLFSKTTWDQTYWLYKERSDDERYYWTPGHEILFYSQVNTQDVPQEAKNIGCFDKNAKGYTCWTTGYGRDRRYHHRVNFDFWKPFVRYQGGDSLLVSVDQLKNIYKDYRSNKHLYSIFISKDEGNFKGLQEGDIDEWWFVVDPDSDHPLTYDSREFSADQLTCTVVESATDDTGTAVLCYYHTGSNEPNTSRHFIGIGVKRAGAEPEPPAPNKKDDDQSAPAGGSSAGTSSKPIAYTTTKMTETFGCSPFNVGVKTKKGSKPTYKSSNKKVATVNKNGKVTVKGAGTVKISITKAGKSVDSVTLTVNKAKNSIKLANKTVKVKQSNLKRRHLKVAINKAKKTKGKVTYALTSVKKGDETFAPFFDINQNTGKITINKALKKGTYKLTVKAKDAGNKNYKASSKSATVTIKVV